MADTVYCSFCGKSQREVRKLVAGPGNFICNECVDLCHDIVHDRPPPDPDPVLWRELTALVDTARSTLDDLRAAITDARFKRLMPRRDEPRGEVVGFGKLDDASEEG